MQGVHLLIDGELREPLSPGAVADFFNQCVIAIGMTAIRPPAIYATAAGIIGFQVIAESHISVHEEGALVFIDVFSCKPFEGRKALSVATKELGLEHINSETILRQGTDSSTHSCVCVGDDGI
jgi:S-adenosylmethionine/arginine decarboxylase-like enzyme